MAFAYVPFRHFVVASFLCVLCMCFVYFLRISVNFSPYVWVAVYVCCCSCMMERRGVYMRIRRRLSFVRTYIPSIYPQSIHLFAGHSYGLVVLVGWTTTLCAKMKQLCFWTFMCVLNLALFPPICCIDMKLVWSRNNKLSMQIKILNDILDLHGLTLLVPHSPPLICVFSMNLHCFDFFFTNFPIRN